MRIETPLVAARLLVCLLVALVLQVQVQGQQFVEQLLLRPLEDGNVLTHAQFTVSSSTPLRVSFAPALQPF